MPMPRFENPAFQVKFYFRYPILLAGAAFLFLPVALSAQPAPPQEAYMACQGRGQGGACGFNAPHGRITGTCRTFPGQARGRTFCVPSFGHRPPPGQGMGQGFGQGRQSGQPGFGRGQGFGPPGFNRGRPQGSRGFGQGPRRRQDFMAGPTGFQGGPGRPPGMGRRPGRGSGGGPGLRGYAKAKPYPGAVKLESRVPETGQSTCFNEGKAISCPPRGKAFYGQDAHYAGTPMQMRDNGNGTISDRITGLMWEKAHHDRRIGFYAARRACRNLKLGGKADWRMPTITELFSIADFSGSIPSRRFYVHKAFDMRVPNQGILANDRFPTHHVNMMGQTWSRTIYKGLHWDRPGVEAAFFFNFLDGRIKQAPTHGPQGLFYRCVRGKEWGWNVFKSNGNGTVSDAASGLMWQKADDGRTRNWKQALNYCENLKLAGRSDWRLPNVKELQHIVDYRRKAPAIDKRYFKVNSRKGWFWSSTTHGDNIRFATYICFGKCTSVDGVDVHGAGAQRSDPKQGNPARYSRGLGGQRDAVRIRNYARCVRG